MRRYEQLACDVDDAVDALDYWRHRRAALPWHRRADRREADQMVANWERRLRHAVLRDPSLTIVERVEAGVLVVRTRGAIAKRRWKRRAQVTAVGTAGVSAAALGSIVGLF
jgi:hypothetical protein